MLRKCISVLLILAVILCAVVIMPVSVSAEDSSIADSGYGKKGYVVYYDNSKTKFSSVYCYLWNEYDNGDVEQEAYWPGLRMTHIGDNMWKFVLPSDYDWIIFSDGVGEGKNHQTDDLHIPSNNAVAKGTYVSEYAGRLYSDYTIDISWSCFDDAEEFALLYCNSSVISGTAVGFNSDWFFNDSLAYNHSISRFCSQIIYEGYQNKSNFKDRKESDLALTLRELGFNITDKEFKFKKGADRDEEDYFIASRTISSNGQDNNFVFVGCIGSNGDQWNSNFDPRGTESKSKYEHDDSYAENAYGFNDAKNYVYFALANYLSDCGYTKENTKILLTGHSRGAAAANLLAAKLIDESHLVYPDNLFAYTFATPNCTTNVNKKTGQSDIKYNRIFNIVNPMDFVTKVLPHNWGYGRYGTTFALPAKTNDSNYKKLKSRMKEYYDIINVMTYGDTKYEDYGDGEAKVYHVVKSFSSSVSNLDDYYNKSYAWSDWGLLSSQRMKPFDYFQKGLCPFAKRKGDANALAVMSEPIISSAASMYYTLSMFFVETNKFSAKFEDAHKIETYCAYMMTLDSREITTKRKGYKGTVNCPVDIEIFDKTTGEIVGRIVNNTIDEEVAAKDNAVVMVVNGDEKEYWLPDNGNYDVRLIGSDTGEMDYSVSEIDSDLGEVSRKNYNDVPVETNRFYTTTIEGDTEDQEPVFIGLSDYNGVELYADEAYVPGKKVEYSIDTDIVGSGNATESLVVTSGDYVTLTATPYHSDFLGWYQSGELVSSKNEYRYRPAENMSLTAKFTEAVFLLGDVNDDESVTIMDASNIQRKLLKLSNRVFIENVADTDGDGVISVTDATFIQRFAAQIATPYFIGKPIEL